LPITEDINKMTKKTSIHKGSENIFEDIGSRNPERTLARAQIMSTIAGIIKTRSLTQKEASGILGIPQSKVSCLVNGKLSFFSLDHLLALLNKLGQDVDIVVMPKRERLASTHVLLAV